MACYKIRTGTPRFQIDAGTPLLPQRNPLNTLLKQIKGLASTHDPGVQQLDDKLYYTLRSTDTTPATFYGLTNIHKPGVPLRPIASSINCPTYQVFKHLASILSPLQNNKYTVINSCDFVEKARFVTSPRRNLWYLSMWYPSSHLNQQLWHSRRLRKDLKLVRPSRKEQRCLLTASWICSNLCSITTTSSLMALSTNKHLAAQWAHLSAQFWQS